MIDNVKIDFDLFAEKRKSIIDYVIKFKAWKIFEVILEKCHDDKKLYPHLNKILRNSSENKTNIGQIFWKIAQKSKKFYNYLLSLDDKQDIKLLLSNLSLNQLFEIFADQLFFKNYSKFLILFILKNLSLVQIKEIFQTELEAKKKNPLNIFLEDRKQHSFEVIKNDFFKHDIYFINKIISKEFSNAKNRFLILQLPMCKLLEYRTKYNTNILIKLLENKQEGLLILILKNIDKHSPALKPKFQDLMTQKNDFSICLSEYLICHNHKATFEFIKNYFAGNFFEKIDYLDVKIVKTVAHEVDFSENDLIQFNEGYLASLRSVLLHNETKLKNIFDSFVKYPNIIDIEKSSGVDFCSKFIDTEAQFNDMLDNLLSQSLVAVDMEYYTVASQYKSKSKQYLYKYSEALINT